MITADLYFNDVKVKTIILDADYPPDTIREYSVEPLTAVRSFFEEDLISQTISCGIWIYQFKGRTGYRSCRYDLIGRQSSVDFARPFGSTLDFGFTEPDENVSLDKLKAKLRDNIKAKELLLKYYRS